MMPAKLKHNGNLTTLAEFAPLVMLFLIYGIYTSDIYQCCAACLALVSSFIENGGGSCTCRELPASGC